MRLRVGLVGLGEDWDARHRPALRALSDRFQVTAVCATVARLAERTAEEFRAAPVDGYRALAARSDVDAVLMLAQDWYGPLPILAACTAGKALYCADVLGFDWRRAEEILRRVDASGIAFMAELPRRLAPATLRLKELIATRLGPVRLVFCHERAFCQKQGHPPTSDKPPIAAMKRDMAELVDWCGYVIGQDPTSVMGARCCTPPSRKPGGSVDCLAASGHAAAGDADDYHMISLDFSPLETPGAGPLAQISWGKYLRTSWPEAAAFRPPAALQVCCQNGVAFVDLPTTLVWFDEAGRHRESLDGERPLGEQLLTQFHRAVTSLVRNTSDLDDARRALHIVNAAEESCQTGQRITEFQK